MSKRDDTPDPFVVEDDDPQTDDALDLETPPSEHPDVDAPAEGPVMVDGPVSTDDTDEAVSGDGGQMTQPADQIEESEGGDPAALSPVLPDADETSDQERGPQGARGYDDSGNVRPADTRADVLIVPEETVDLDGTAAEDSDEDEV